MNPAPQAADGGRTRPCDLVMKGGITSGVVYPMAILELSKNYHFRGIGGASAGAIAAAATAAAELGRARNGFTKLDRLCRDLAIGGTLKGLFQAAPATRPLLDLLLSYVDVGENPKAGGRPAWVWSLVRPLLRRVVWTGV